MCSLWLTEVILKRLMAFQTICIVSTATRLAAKQHIASNCLTISITGTIVISAMIAIITVIISIITIIIIKQTR